MEFDLHRRLFEEGLIGPESSEKIKKRYAQPLFSLHWELKTILYLGVMLLSSGLGILIYKNIDTIGHQAILTLIASVSTVCFFYCFKKKAPFSKTKVKSPDSFFDYILLLACLSFISFLGYLQFQYTVFGNHYELATLIPMMVLYYVAYAFDHQGIQGLAITNMALFMGISATPRELLSNGIFAHPDLLYTYLLLAFILLAMAWLSEKLDFKKHFKFNYLHFGVHLGFITLLSGYFYYYELGTSIFWLLGVAVLAYPLYVDAIKDKSFYFLLLVVLYSYIAISALIVRMMLAVENFGILIMLPLYFIITAIILIRTLVNLNKKVK